MKDEESSVTSSLSLASSPKSLPPGHIGLDEAGKGDYFGDLVIAAAFLPDEFADNLRRAGVKDTKQLSDGRVFELEKAVRQICECEVIRISPPKYNELYAKMRNLNRLLAWGHARALENLLARVDAKLVIADQFADARLLQSALMDKGKQVELRQMVRAEADFAVAAAAILARAEFLRSLRRLSEKYAIPLPKGATHVIPTARLVVAKGGKELLGQVAKLHFKTTEQVLAGKG